MQSGPEQLKAWVERRFGSQREAAKYLGMDETVLSKILSAERTPGLGKAVAIEGLTGIPVEAWVSSKTDETETVSAVTARKPR